MTVFSAMAGEANDAVKVTAAKAASESMMFCMVGSFEFSADT